MKDYVTRPERDGEKRKYCQKCGAIRIDSQIGLEETPDAYIAKLVQVFHEVKRVLKDDGVLWLNLGDSYASMKSRYSQKEQTVLGKPQDNIFNGNKTDLYHHKETGLKDKDLIGIPWMAAFALRQPYEHCHIKDSVWRSWLAGIIDGEGCITTNEVETSMDDGRAVNPSYPIILQVRMSDRQALEKIVEVSGVSKVQDEHLSPSQIGTLQRAPSCWKTSGNNAMDLLAECYPYLTVKRKQALVAWNLQMLKDGVETKRGVPIPKENMEKRKLLYSVIRELNQRREVNIPSWCKEPQIITEPGWYLRSDIVWAKPNPMPESVKDRPTKSHEYIFMLSKSQKYYYDYEAVLEPCTSVELVDGEVVKHGKQAFSYNSNKPDKAWVPKNLQPDGQQPNSMHVNRANGLGEPDQPEMDGVPARNKRDVWTITTKPYKEAHFATFPEEIPEICIKAGSKPGDTVLDPFNGSGTTGSVAVRLGREYIGIELNPAYIELSKKRLSQTQLAII